MVSPANHKERKYLSYVSSDRPRSGHLRIPRRRYCLSNLWDGVIKNQVWTAGKKQGGNAKLKKQNTNLEEKGEIIVIIVTSSQMAISVLKFTQKVVTMVVTMNHLVTMVTIPKPSSSPKTPGGLCSKTMICDDVTMMTMISHTYSKCPD